MSFDDLLADTNEAFMDAYAETALVTYRPSGGTPRQILAIIDRPAPEPAVNGEKPVSRPFMIWVQNDPVAGIAITSFDAGIDKVDLPLVLGGSLVTRGFTRDKAEHDGGMIGLKVV